MRVSDTLRKKIETEINNLSYLKKKYKKRIVNIDKGLFLCIINMPNNDNIEMAYIQVWDNKKEVFLFAKKQFFSTETSIDKKLNFSNRENIYSFFVNNEYLFYSARNRKFIDFTAFLARKDDKISITSVKLAKDINGKPNRFIELFDSFGKREFIFDVELEMIIQVVPKKTKIVGYIAYRYIIMLDIKNAFLIDTKENSIINISENEHKIEVVSISNHKQYSYAIQLSESFILVDYIKNEIKDCTGIYHSSLYNDFIIYYRKDMNLFRILYDSVVHDFIDKIDDIDSIRIEDVDDGKYIQRRIGDKNDFIVIKSGDLPYRIFIIYDTKTGKMIDIKTMDL